MTAQDAIRWVDGKKHNVYSQEDKLFWLSQVEAMAARLHGRCGLEQEIVEMEPETVLSIPAPSDALYLRWLEARIDYANAEYTRYNNSMDMFRAVYQSYRSYFNRTHMPKGVRFRF